MIYSLEIMLSFNDPWEKTKYKLYSCKPNDIVYGIDLWLSEGHHHSVDWRPESPIRHQEQWMGGIWHQGKLWDQGRCHMSSIFEHVHSISNVFTPVSICFCANRCATCRSRSLVVPLCGPLIWMTLRDDSVVRDLTLFSLISANFSILVSPSHFYADVLL